MKAGGSSEAQIAPPRGLGPAWETAIVCLVGLCAAVVNEYLCLALFGALVCWLVVRHIRTPADVMGILFAVNCATPLLRRIHDLLHGYRPGSMILIAQYIGYPVVGLITLKSLHRFRTGWFVPILLGWVGMLWAYCVGLLEVGIYPATMQLLEFSGGPILCAYAMVNFERLDVGKFCRWLLVLGAIEGAYGAMQWVVVPAWDAYWFNSAGMQSAGGIALPFQMRTFGTINSTSPYSYFLFFTLVVTISTPGYVFAAPLMIAGLATTLARSAWGAAVLGLAINVLIARGKDKPMVLMPILKTLLVVSVLALPFAPRLTSLVRRVQTMSDVKNDNSFKDRSKLMDAAIKSGAFEDPVGVGFGFTGAAAKASGRGIVGIDNGFLATLWVFGWTGTIFFVGGVLIGMFRGIQGAFKMPLERLQFVGSLFALFVANLFETAFGGIKGPMVWLSIGITNMWIVDRSRRIAAGGVPAVALVPADLPANGPAASEADEEPGRSKVAASDRRFEPNLETLADPAMVLPMFATPGHRGESVSEPRPDAEAGPGRASRVEPDAAPGLDPAPVHVPEPVEPPSIEEDRTSSPDSAQEESVPADLVPAPEPESASDARPATERTPAPEPSVEPDPDSDRDLADSRETLLVPRTESVPDRVAQFIQDAWTSWTMNTVSPSGPAEVEEAQAGPDKDSTSAIPSFQDTDTRPTVEIVAEQAPGPEEETVQSALVPAPEPESASDAHPATERTPAPEPSVEPDPDSDRDLADSRETLLIPRTESVPDRVAQFIQDAWTSWTMNAVSPSGPAEVEEAQAGPDKDSTSAIPSFRDTDTRPTVEVVAEQAPEPELGATDRNESEFPGSPVEPEEPVPAPQPPPPLPKAVDAWLRWSDEVSSVRNPAPIPARRTPPPVPLPPVRDALAEAPPAPSAAPGDAPESRAWILLPDVSRPTHPSPQSSLPPTPGLDGRLAVTRGESVRRVAPDALSNWLKPPPQGIQAAWEAWAGRPSEDSDNEPKFGWPRRMVQDPSSHPSNPDEESN